MSDHEVKSRSIKELKAKKHHEKLSLLRVSVKEIVHREKMEPQFVILLDPMPEVISMGFQMLT